MGAAWPICRHCSTRAVVAAALRDQPGPSRTKLMSLYLKRFPRAFRRLHWRFALSYMLVTVCSVAMLPISYFLASYLVVVRSADLPRVMAAGLEPIAAQTLPYLVQVPADQAGLRVWLVDFNSNGRVQ